MSKILEGNGNGSGAGSLLPPAKRRVPRPAPVAPAAGDRGNRVTFETRDGLELSGVPVRITRHHASFELYHPDFVPRLSEAIDEFAIILQTRTVYSGRAVVSNLVDAGSKKVFEVTLEEKRWLDVSAELVAACDQRLVEEFGRFVGDWQKLYRVLPEFKEAITDIEMFLTDLRLWLEQVELAIHSLPEPGQRQLEQAVIKKLSPEIIPLLNGLFERFETIAHKLEEERRPAHRNYIQRHLHPIVLCAPFARRAYEKPLGYPGDYEMVNMMARNPQEGASLFAKIFNVWLIEQGSATAHRNRLTYLTKCIEMETLRVARSGRNARIFNFACGPAIEVQQFLEDSPLCDQIELTLADFDNETLAHTQKAIARIKERRGWRTPVQFQKRNVHQLIKEGYKQAAKSGNGKYAYDFVYCAGLFDYLTDSACRQIVQIFYDWLAPGGLLVVTNVTPLAPNRGSLELILDWHLIYRNVAQFEQIGSGIIARDDIRIRSDKTGINIFLEARKPHDG